MKRFLTTGAPGGEPFQCADVKLRKPRHEPEMGLVKLYPDIRYQRIVGFGAALTEASAYVFAQMPDSLKVRFAELCFGEVGNRYSLARLSLQSCDFSLEPRAYLDQKPVRRSGSLDGFSIRDDAEYVIPLAKVALAANPALEFLASPWSPPAWAKTNGTMKHGGRLRRDCYGVWARMMARALAAYRDEGIPIGRITVQNECQATQIWESCLYDAREERDFVKDHLKPALRDEGLGCVKVLAWDHNKERMLDRALALLGPDGCPGDVDGVAFHWYSGDHFDALRATRELVGSGRELIFSEGCDCYTAGDSSQELPHAEHYAHEVLGDLEAGANGILDWNILLDQHGGPNHVGNFCDAPLMYDTRSGRLNVRLPFHYLGHFSRYIQPGAERILSTSHTTALETTAFANPDGSFALVALNRGERRIAFDLTWGGGALDGRVAHLEAPPHSIQTITWQDVAERECANG